MSKTVELKELTRVRVLTFLREPEAIFWVFFFPMVLAAVLGFAFRSGGVAPVSVAVLSEGETPPPIVAAFDADEHIEYEIMSSAEEARRLPPVPRATTRRAADGDQSPRHHRPVRPGRDSKPIGTGIPLRPRAGVCIPNASGRRARPALGGRGRSPPWSRSFDIRRDFDFRTTARDKRNP